MCNSIFTVIRKGPAVEMFALSHAYLVDKCQPKVDLANGNYKCPTGNPWVFPVVRKVQMKLAKNVQKSSSYLPVLGDIPLRDAAVKLLLGPKSKIIQEKRAVCVQTLAGTGAFRLGAALLRSAMCRKKFVYSDPTATNYNQIFTDAGFEDSTTYCYWKQGAVNLDAVMEALCDADSGSVVILSVCGHNPTGQDLKPDQWKEVAAIMKNKNHIPFFDCNAMGMATGDPDKDAWPVRYFAEQGFEMFVAQSFAQSFGLYNERVGCLTIIQNNTKTTDNIKSRLSLLVRGTYMAPPAFGAHIVSNILNNKCLRKEWLDTLQGIAKRLKVTRRSLVERLEDMETPGAWYPITKQRGLFSIAPLCPNHVDALIKDYHIYLQRNGRMNVSSINSKNFDYIMESIHNVLTGKKPPKKDCSPASTKGKPSSAPCKAGGSPAANKSPMKPAASKPPVKPAANKPPVKPPANKPPASPPAASSKPTPKPSPSSPAKPSEKK